MFTGSPGDLAPSLMGLNLQAVSPGNSGSIPSRYLGEVQGWGTSKGETPSLVECSAEAKTVQGRYGHVQWKPDGKATLWDLRSRS